MPKVPASIPWLAVVLTLGGSPSLLGQGTGASTGDVHDDDVHLARVVIDGETLFAVRGITARPAERRAREIADKIRALAANPRIVASSLTIEERPASTLIKAAGQQIMALLDGDAAMEQTARGPLAQLYRTRIWEAVEAYRRDRRPVVLWRLGIHALIATGVLLAAIKLGRRTVVKLRAFLERRCRLRIEGLENRSYHIVKVEQIWRALTGLLNGAEVLGIAVIIYSYLHYVFALFPWTRGLAKSLFAIAIDPLRTIGSGLVAMIPSLAFLAILVVVTRYALKTVRVLVDGIASGTVTFRGFDPDWAWPTYRLVRLLVIVFAVVAAYPHIPGSGSEAFKGVSLFAGVVFSLGSSSLIGNFIAGYSMTYRGAFKIGDRVRIGQHVGDVERMRLLVTHLRTPKNEEVVVPNSMILNGEVVNYSSMARQLGLILHTTVGIGYETPWRQVEAMLLKAAAHTPGLRREPPPYVLQTALGDFSVTYEINVYCDTPQAMPLLYTELHRSILDVFNEYGVQIMTPAYESDPDQPKVVPKEQWYVAPAHSARPEPAVGAGPIR